MQLFVNYTEYRYGGEICAGDEDSDWPSYEDENIDWNITGCSLTESKYGYSEYYETVDVPDCKIEDTVYIVYVRYSTGDTFGHINGCWRIMGVFLDPAEADKLYKSINDNSYEGYRFWEGYFERLESCQVESFVIK